MNSEMVARHFSRIATIMRAVIVSELWFLYRRHFVEQSLYLKKRPDKTLGEKLMYFIYTVLTLGAYDVSEESLHKDEKAIKILAAIGIPVACFLHGYAGFIFGSVKANALWMTPLMPVIFSCQQSSPVLPSVCSPTS